MQNAAKRAAGLHETLLSRQNGDGGWGGYPGGTSRTESTALALLALTHPDPATPDAEAALGWLLDRQDQEGWWPGGPDLAGPSWMTSLAVLALAGVPRVLSRAVRGAEWLLPQHGAVPSWWNRLILRLSGRADDVDLDATLRGWAWTPDTFSWVEPTAYAVLALRTLREELESEGAARRIEEGERMILDRMCVGGGWNYGNARVLGEELWPYPDTTALALLALQGREADERVETSFAALDRMTADTDSFLVLSLAVLCHRVYRRDPAAPRTRLEARVAAGHVPADARSLCLGLLALAEGPTPLGV